MMDSAEAIRLAQRTWAIQHGIPVDEHGYTLHVDDNLFEPLRAEAKKEFELGAGGETQEGKRRPKMCALHSSSALAVNIFHYWRYRNVDVVARACDAQRGMSALAFEVTHRTPLPRFPPHLDVEMRGPGLAPTAVESKFTEPYGSRRQPFALRPSYADDKSLWDGLSCCRALAKSIVQGSIKFYRLDAPQLLKHILGLATAYGQRGFDLLYLYYDVVGGESKEHHDEIKQFHDCLGAEVSSRTLTYQELYGRMNARSADHRGYFGYMGARYFPR